MDCRSLTWLQTQDQTPGAMVRCWLDVLANNGFEIINRARTLHTKADSLSRRPRADPVTDSNDKPAHELLGAEEECTGNVCF